MVLQMCSMALRMTGSLVSSSWCLQETQQIGKNPFTLSTEATKFLFPSQFIHFCFFVLLDENLHDGFADLHPHAVLLKHVEERQEALLMDRGCEKKKSQTR